MNYYQKYIIELIYYHQNWMLLVLIVIISNINNNNNNRNKVYTKYRKGQCLMHIDKLIIVIRRWYYVYV